MTTSTISKRVLSVFKSPLDIKTCSTQLSHHKLECSECNLLFDTEFDFAIHIHRCLLNADKHTLHYQAHLYANRILLVQDKIAQLCGNFANIECLECTQCKDRFEDEIFLKHHIKYCFNQKKETSEFMDKTEALFLNLENSHEQLGSVLQKFASKEHNLETLKAMNVDVEQMMNYFSEKALNFRMSLDAFTDDVFVRYLMRKQVNSNVSNVQFTFPEEQEQEAVEVDEVKPDVGKEEVAESSRPVTVSPVANNTPNLVKEAEKTKEKVSKKNVRRSLRPRAAIPRRYTMDC